MRITTAFIFLLFSGVVAFSHVLLHDYTYIVFTVPFVLACILKNTYSKISETVGLLVIGIYGLVIKDEYIGLTILYAASCWFFVYVHRGRRAAWFIVAVTLIIGLTSYFIYFHDTDDRLTHAVLDACLYGLGAWALVHTINQLVRSVRAEKMPIDSSILELIEELQTIAHKYVDTLKRGANDDRRGDH